MIAEEYDAGGNIISQRPPSDETGEPDAPIVTATARGLGRLSSRVRATLNEEFGYAADGGNPAHLAPGPPSGLLGRVRAELGGTTAAGSVIDRDGARRVASSTDLGMRRRDAFAYDDRGRLEVGGDVTDTLVHADFRQARTVTPDARDRAELGVFASSVLPASWTALKNDAHHITSRTLEGESSPRMYDFANGRRASDGVWQHGYDEENRLVSLTKGDERIRYIYNPANRIVGRIVEQQIEGVWRLETRTNILARDALPADTTWVWDPVTDRLVAVFESGGRLLRQILHGGTGYDDPLVYLIANDQGQPHKFLPIIDRSSGGSITAVAGGNGKLAERILYADAYGDAPRYLHGPVVDRIATSVSKDANGAITEVKVRVRVTEEIDAATLATGVRLSAVDEFQSNAVVATASVTPAIGSDDRTIEWTLSAGDWAALSATPASHIEIAVTDALRATLWDGPVMPLAAWQLDEAGRASRASSPVIHRERVARIVSGAGAGQTSEQTLLAISDLYLVASVESRTKLLTGFKACPFRDPATGLVYARARWYDASTGTFLSPDPAGYADSSNVYAAFRNDPVNTSDPTGRVALVDNLAGCAASTLIGWGITEATGGNYTWKDAGIDCGLGFATSGLSSLGHLRHTSKFVRWGARVGAEAALDIGAEAARREWKGEDYTWGELVAGSAVNTFIGESGSHFVGSIWRNRRALLAKAPGVLRQPVSEVVGRVLASSSLRGRTVDFDAYRFYDSRWSRTSSNPTSIYRYSSPSFRDTSSDVYFGGHASVSYLEVRGATAGENLWRTRVRATGILDLTDARVLRRYIIDPSRLAQRTEDIGPGAYDYTHEVERFAYRRGYTGILFPSAQQPGAENLMLFSGRYGDNVFEDIFDVP